MALDPARALLDPGAQAAVGFFVRGGRQHFGAQPVARQPHAQVGILGHVVGIPGAHPLDRVAPQEQRGAPQRHRPAQALQGGHHHPEPAGVFGGEQPRHQVGARVVIVEAALQAGHVRAPFGKALHNLADLVGVGRILGIVDADDRAAGEIQRIVHRPRFGGDRPVGHGDHPHPGGQAAFGQCRAGFGILRLQHDHHIEQRPRIVEPPQPLQQPRRDAGFAVKRHQDRHHRQAQGQGRGRGVGPAAPVGPGPGQRQRAHRRGGQQRQHQPDQQQRQHRLRCRHHQNRHPPQHQRQDRPLEAVGPAARAEVAGHAGLGGKAQGQAAGLRQRRLDRGQGGMGRGQRAEGGFEFGGDARPGVGARDGHLNRPGHPAQRHHPQRQAPTGAEPVDQPGIGRMRQRVGHRPAGPLRHRLRQGRRGNLGRTVQHLEQRQARRGGLGLQQVEVRRAQGADGQQAGRQRRVALRPHRRRQSPYH